MGSNLVTKEMIEAKDYPAVTGRVKDTLALTQSIRAGK